MQFELQAAWQEAHALVDKNVNELLHCIVASEQHRSNQDPAGIATSETNNKAS